MPSRIMVPLVIFCRFYGHKCAFAAVLCCADLVDGESFEKKYVLVEKLLTVILCVLTYRLFFS